MAEAKQYIKKTRIDFSNIAIGKKYTMPGFYKILEIKLCEYPGLADITYIHKMGWTTPHVWLTEGSNFTDNYKYITSITLPDGTDLYLFELLDL